MLKRLKFQMIFHPIVVNDILLAMLSFSSTFLICLIIENQNKQRLMNTRIVKLVTLPELIISSKGYSRSMFIDEGKQSL